MAIKTRPIKPPLDAVPIMAIIQKKAAPFSANLMYLSFTCVTKYKIKGIVIFNPKATLLLSPNGPCIPSILCPPPLSQIFMPSITPKKQRAKHK